MKSNSSRLSTRRLLSSSTTLARLVRWISGTLVASMSWRKAPSASYWNKNKTVRTGCRHARWQQGRGRPRACTFPRDARARPRHPRSPHPPVNRRQQVPGPVRPARPDRWLAAACDSGYTCSAGGRVGGGGDGGKGRAGVTRRPAGQGAGCRRPPATRSTGKPAAQHVVRRGTPWCKSYSSPPAARGTCVCAPAARPCPSWGCTPSFSRSCMPGREGHNLAFITRHPTSDVPLSKAAQAGRAVRPHAVTNEA